MKSHLPLVSLLALSVLNVSCSDNTVSSGEVTADLPQSEAELLASRTPATPVISARSYTSGSAIVKVTGSFQVDAEIPINTQASHSDGEMTWLQYGASGAETPNSLVTVSPSEVGLSATLGKKTAIAEAGACTGSMNVTDKLVSGSYKCVDAASHDPGVTSNFGMGKVTIEISFTAGS
jgi:hypothetical protein